MIGFARFTEYLIQPYGRNWSFLWNVDVPKWQILILVVVFFVFVWIFSEHIGVELEDFDENIGIKAEDRREFGRDRHLEKFEKRLEATAHLIWVLYGSNEPL